jgi:hypothetical protein
MRRSATSFKRNDGARVGILIAPLELPHFSRPLNSTRRTDSPITLNGKSASGPNLAARMASRSSVCTESFDDIGSVCAQEFLPARWSRILARLPWAHSSRLQ